MPELNYEEDLEINPDALDVECLRQPTLFYRYSAHEADCKRTLAEAHEDLKTIRSELIMEARQDKSIKNAQQLEAYYRTDPRYIKVKDKMIQAEYEANMASTAVWAFNTRKAQLENLVKLALADYFARPAEPRNLSEEVDKTKEREQATTEARSRAKSRMKRRTK